MFQINKVIMEEIKQIIKEIVWLAETHSPTIHDLAEIALEKLNSNTFYTHNEVLEILNRKEGIETEE